MTNKQTYQELKNRIAFYGINPIKFCEEYLQLKLNIWQKILLIQQCKDGLFPKEYLLEKIKNDK